MAADLIYHFPPDVFDALADAIPLLVRARKDVLLFFRGCGVDRKLLEDLTIRMDWDRDFGKYAATRHVLTVLNDRGEPALRERREVVRRVAEFDEFASCYPDNRLKAQGAVATVRQLVNKKDAFTRMDLAREEEQRKHREAIDAAMNAEKAKRQALERTREDLFRLFGEKDPHRRGKALEGVLNRLFDNSGILVREAFVVTNPEGGGAVEQIDGAVELDGRLYLAEMKWWNKPLGRVDVDPHLVSVFSRGEAGGIFISASGYHDSAIEDFKGALAHRVVVLVELQEIVDMFRIEASLVDLLRAKIKEATLTKRPLTFPLRQPV